LRLKGAVPFPRRTKINCFGIWKFPTDSHVLSAESLCIFFYRITVYGRKKSIDFLMCFWKFDWLNIDEPIRRDVVAPCLMLFFGGA
jgi:hypothetical protein